MYTNTRFGELLKVLPKNTFKRRVEQHRSDKHNTYEPPERQAQK